MDQVALATSRKLLASSKGAQTTYIVLAVIAVALIALGVGCCVAQGRCGRCGRRSKNDVDADEKDVDLTSVLSGATSRGTLHSFSSAATSPQRGLNRTSTNGRDTASRTSAPGHNRASDSGSLPDSPGSSVWSGKLHPGEMPIGRHAPLVGPNRKPASSMAMLSPFRGARLKGAPMRQGTLPTIPSLPSMGSVTRSDASDMATSLGGIATDHSNLGNGGGTVTERSTLDSDPRSTPGDTPAGSERVGASPQAAEAGSVGRGSAGVARPGSAGRMRGGARRCVLASARAASRRTRYCRLQRWRRQCPSDGKVE